MKLRSSQFTILPVLLSLIISGCHPAAGAEDAAVAKAPVSITTVAATLRPIDETLSVTGNFVPSQGGAAKLTPAIAGRIEAVYVHEGDRVQKGQILATLDLRVQQGQKDAATAALLAAQSQALQSKLSYQAANADQQATVKNAEIGLTTAELDRQNSIDQAALALQSAEADLAKTKAGARPQELAQAHEATVQARLARDKAASDFKRTKALAPDGLVSKKDLEDADATAKATQSALNAASQAEALMKLGARPEELKSMQAHADAAQAALASAKALGDQHVRAAKSALDQARKGVLLLRAKSLDVTNAGHVARQRQAESSTATASKELAEIRAPYDGKISRRLLNPGDSADTTTPVLEIVAEGANVDFLGNVLAAQAAQVQRGAKAKITLKDESIDGTVLSVSPADPTSGLCAVRIATTAQIITGTFSTAQISIHHFPSAVAIPDTALIDHEGKSSAFKVVDGAAKQVDVEIGPSQDGFTAIQKGLNAGDVVVATGAYELSDGDKVKVESPDDKDKKDPSPADKEPGH